MNLPGFTHDAAGALPLHIVGRLDFATWREAQPAGCVAWLQAQGFDGSAGTALCLPGADGSTAAAMLGVGDGFDPMAYAHAPFALPPRAWRLAGGLDAAAHAALVLGWGLGSYRFGRYKAAVRTPATLVLEGEAGNAADALDQVAACARVRDLVNTPTEHMGPDQLEQVCCEIAERFGAQIEVISGEDLLARNFPAIHAVGRASHRAPRLIALRWGQPQHPHVAIVGKGV